MNTVKNKINLEKLGVKQLRQRLFVKRSELLFGLTTYEEHYVDDAIEQLEALKEFTAWETFSEEWDILWYGLDPQTNSWIPGRHHSPMRQVSHPIRIVKLDLRTKRMEVPFQAKADMYKLPQINIHFEETEEDRAISESLSGKVVIDELDEDKAARMIEQTMKDLENKLALIKGINKK